MIVECPGCQSRYDVTGRPAGTKARCRCGTVFVLPEPSARAGMMECPRCGGNVAATNHTCEFCSAELLIKACPRCFAKIFHGAKHCSHCGASVVTPVAAEARPDEATGRLCPRCPGDQPLEARLVADVLLDECLRCHGVFVDVDALERVLSERRQVRAEAIQGALGTLADGAAPAQVQQVPLYIRCPVCRNMMNRRSFALGSKVIVDVCRSHGTWFDPDELPQIIDFVMKGGLEQAERRRLEQERERLQQEKHAVRLARSGSTGEPGVGWAPDPFDEGISIGGLFQAIHTLIQGARKRFRDE
jgi:Zn-finger nucleic acid-binding protein